MSTFQDRKQFTTWFLDAAADALSHEGLEFSIQHDCLIIPKGQTLDTFFSDISQILHSKMECDSNNYVFKTNDDQILLFPGFFS